MRKTINITSNLKWNAIITSQTPEEIHYFLDDDGSESEDTSLDFEITGLNWIKFDNGGYSMEGDGSGKIILNIEDNTSTYSRVAYVCISSEDINDGLFRSIKIFQNAAGYVDNNLPAPTQIDPHDIYYRTKDHKSLICIGVSFTEKYLVSDTYYYDPANNVDYGIMHHQDKYTSLKSTSTVAEELEENENGIAYALGFTQSGFEKKLKDQLVDFVTHADVTSLSSKQFNDCENLKSFPLPTNLTVIPAECFDSCCITNVDLGPQIEYIGYNAFANTEIESIVFPNTLKAIGTGAFSGCEKLNDITFKSISGVVFAKTGGSVTTQEGGGGQNKTTTTTSYYPTFGDTTGSDSEPDLPDTGTLHLPKYLGDIYSSYEIDLSDTSLPDTNGDIPYWREISSIDDISDTTYENLLFIAKSKSYGNNATTTRGTQSTNLIGYFKSNYPGWTVKFDVEEEDCQIDVLRGANIGWVSGSFTDEKYKVQDGDSPYEDRTVTLKAKEPIDESYTDENGNTVSDNKSDGRMIQRAARSEEGNKYWVLKEVKLPFITDAQLARSSESESELESDDTTLRCYKDGHQDEIFTVAAPDWLDVKWDIENRYLDITRGDIAEINPTLKIKSCEKTDDGSKISYTLNWEGFEEYENNGGKIKARGGNLNSTSGAWNNTEKTYTVTVSDGGMTGYKVYEKNSTTPTESSTFKYGYITFSVDAITDDIYIYRNDKLVDSIPVSLSSGAKITDFFKNFATPMPQICHAFNNTKCNGEWVDVTTPLTKTVTFTSYINTPTFYLFNEDGTKVTNFNMDTSNSTDELDFSGVDYFENWGGNKFSFHTYKSGEDYPDTPTQYTIPNDYIGKKFYIDLTVTATNGAVTTTKPESGTAGIDYLVFTTTGVKDSNNYYSYNYAFNVNLESQFIGTGGKDGYGAVGSTHFMKKEDSQYYYMSQNNTGYIYNDTYWITKLDSSDGVHYTIRITYNYKKNSRPGICISTKENAFLRAKNTDDGQVYYEDTVIDPQYYLASNTLNNFYINVFGLNMPTKNSD